MTMCATLPDLNSLTKDSLKALILVQHETLTAQEETLHSQDDQLASHQAEIEWLKLMIAKLQRMKFRRRSEKLERQIEQLDELVAERAEKAAASFTSQPSTEKVNATKPARRVLPVHLLREVQEMRPKKRVFPDCGGELKPLGEDFLEMLEWVWASLKGIRQLRPKLACARCGKIVRAEAASRPIARGMVGLGLLAHVLASKYCDHLPLYRQSEIYTHAGVELERATLADWVGGASQLLQPLIAELRRQVMSPEILDAEDTPVPVLAPGLGKTKLRRLWTYVRDDRPATDPTPPAVWFAYSPDRKGEHPAKYLCDICGVLQVDAYAEFNQLYEDRRIQEAACWAHIRRKFYDLHAAHKSPVAQEALKRIAALYAIES